MSYYFVRIWYRYLVSTRGGNCPKNIFFILDPSLYLVNSNSGSKNTISCQLRKPDIILIDEFLFYLLVVIVNVLSERIGGWYNFVNWVSLSIPVPEIIIFGFDQQALQPWKSGFCFFCDRLNVKSGYQTQVFYLSWLINGYVEIPFWYEGIVSPHEGHQKIILISTIHLVYWWRPDVGFYISFQARFQA
jgi:hypothetical protein